MLFSLLRASKTILLRFSSLLVFDFFAVPLLKEKTKRRLTLTILTGTAAVANEAIEMPSLIADKKK